jgi:hypothetical protein
LQTEEMSDGEGAAASRCVLRAMKVGSLDEPQPAFVIDVVADAITVLDPATKTVVALVPRGELTAEPKHRGGIPVLVLSASGMPTLSIRPHHGWGTWRHLPSARRPDYLVTDAEFDTLVDTLGMSRSPKLPTVRLVIEHLFAFIEEFGPYSDITWRMPFVFGLLAMVFAAIAPTTLPISLVVGVVLLVVAAAAWRFQWRI